jgi:hypothetical protein
MDLNLNTLPDDPIGAAWLAKAFDALPMGRFPVLSQIGGRRATLLQDGFVLENFEDPRATLHALCRRGGSLCQRQERR